MNREWKNKILMAVDKRAPSSASLNHEPGSKSDFDLMDKPSDRLDPRDLKPASVIVGIVEREKPQLFLTRRSEQLKQHSGQIAFPGGKVDGLDNSLIDTALREAHEEIGLMQKNVEILGLLPKHETGTGYRILPVVVFIQPKFIPKIDKSEVAETFEVPFEFLMNEKTFY